MAAAILAALAGAARADDELPKGRYALAIGMRQNAGTLGSAFRFGGTVAVEGGYLPGAIGPAWALRWGYFPSGDESRADQTLWTIELDFGLRLRRPLAPEGGPPLLVAVGGLTLLRSNVPVPPDEERLYVGPYAGLGVETDLGGRLLGLEARYGLLFGGPGALTLQLSFAWGS
jgi:hypothetical protein